MLGFDIFLTQTYRHFQQDFEDLGKIGSGGFAQVHKVRSRLDNRIYALKIIEIRPTQCKQDIIETIHKFLDEVKILSYLNHKNIIHYHGCWVQTEKEQHPIKLHKTQNYEEKIQNEDEQIVMVMEEDFSSSGIQFGSSAQEPQDDLVFEEEDRTKQTNNYVETPLDHTTASASIRQQYKTIKVFVLTELCENNLQQYLYLRNIARKNTLKYPRKGSLGGRPLQLGQQSSHNKFRSPKKLSYDNIDQTPQPSNPLSHVPSIDQLITNYKLIIQIIQGLEYLHSKKIIHRDMKLHNIVISQQKCKIIDYGLAKKTRMLQSIDYHPKDFSCQNLGLMHLDIGDDEKLDEIFSSSVGTRIYSSPQQQTSQRYDHRTDIYSLAIVILMFFCDFTTNHEQLSIIEKIRKLDIGFIHCDEKLKNVMIKCLGEEKSRPRLSEIKTVVRQLLRQKYMLKSGSNNNNNNDKSATENNASREKQSTLQKQETIYILQNARLKKKISKEDYLLLNAPEDKKDKQSSTSSNSISSVNDEEKKRIKQDRIKDLQNSPV